MTMKSKIAVAGIVLLFVLVLMPLSGVIATEQTPPITYHDHSTTWTIDLVHPISYLPEGYNGQDITSVEVAFTIATDPVTEGQIPYLRYSKTAVQLKIWFDINDLPEVPEEEWIMYIIVTFPTGDEVISGPGYAYRYY